jgi:lipoprotein-releasing system permease protein
MSSLFTVLGICVGFIAIFVIIGVMNGLQSGFLGDIIELQSFHMYVDIESDADLDTVMQQIQQIDGIQTVIPYLDTNALIEYRKGQYIPCMIRGADDRLFHDDAGFIEHAHLSQDFPKKLSEMDIVISEYMEKSFAKPVGSSMDLLLMGVGKVVRHVPITVSTTILETYSSDSPDIDSHVVFMSLDTLKKILPSQVPRLGIKLTNIENLNLKDTISSIEGVKEVTTWKESNQSFYSALMLEKYSMLILLSLIFLVVIMNAKTSFEKYVFFKKDDIGILRSMGASKEAIYTVFMVQGLVIIMVGILTGVLFGFIIATNINSIVSCFESIIGTITDRQVRLLAYDLPVQIKGGELLVLCVFVLTISLLNLFFAIKDLIKRSPLEILRYE